ncbi:MAG: DUF2357 domain-containing protein [Candidatus Bathyarchaeia archaeon]
MKEGRRLGKYYTRRGGDLYIYVTGDDEMIDLGLFPPALNLFQAESAWRLKGKIAIANDCEEESLDQAEATLKANGYTRMEVAADLLVDYYLHGDESRLSDALGEARPPDQAALPEPGRVEEVIMPEILPIMPERAKPEVAGPPGVEPRIEPRAAIRSRREEPVEGAVVEELREFSLHLVHSRFGDEIKESLQALLHHVMEHWEALEPTLEMIARAPRHRLSKRRVKKLIREMNGVDPSIIDSLTGGLEGAADSEDGGGAALQKLLRRIPLRVEVEESYIDYDVEENRLLRHHLDSLSTQLSILLRTAERRDLHLRRALKFSEGEETVEAAGEFLSNHEMVRSIGTLRKRIEARLREPRMSFLSQVTPQSLQQGPTPTLESHPHYSRFHQLYRSFKESAPPPPATPRLALLEAEQDAELYRRWCATKIMEAAIELGYRLEEERMTRMEADEIVVEVSPGLLSTLARAEKRLRIYYDRRYVREPPYGSYSAPRRVTIALEAFGEGEVPRIVVFEPRYDPEYTEEKFTSRDVDGLHVLRDSIVDLTTEDRERLVVGGFILHPAEMGPVRYDGLSALSLRPGAENIALIEALGELLG